jgi:hypothetical protein
VLASIWVLLIPLWVLLGILVLFGLLALLGRWRGGKYLRPIFTTLAKVPILKRLLEKASTAALERSNPELASAMKKIQRYGGAVTTDPVKAQQALSRLSAQERRALLDVQEQQGIPTENLSREQRRRLERAKRRRR